MKEQPRREELERQAHSIPRPRAKSNRWFVRKLKKILKELKPLVEQGRVEGFVNNVKNADKLGGLVEDIRDAMMEYQAYIRNLSISDMYLTFAPDFVTTGHLRKQSSAHRESHPLVPHESRRVTCV